MDEQWIKSPTARRILVHWADSRPAWLWSADGSKLLWRNAAARLFLARLKKSGLKLAPDPVPIKGQVARLIRLGSIRRSSLSRIQFLAGEKPVSTTCTCTPLVLEDEQKALLIVGVDAIEGELLATPEAELADALSLSLFPPGSEYLVAGDDGRVVGGSAVALERYAPAFESEGIPDVDAEVGGTAMLDGETVTITRYSADQRSAMLLLIEPAIPADAGETIDDVREDEGLDDELDVTEPMLPLGLAPLVIERGARADEPAERWTEYHATDEPSHKLSSLFDRLVDDAGLFTSLTEADDHFVSEPAHPAAIVEATGAEPYPRDAIAEIIERAEAEAAAAEAQPAAEHLSLPAGETAAKGEPTEPPAVRSASQVDDAIELPGTADDDLLVETSPAIWRVTGRGFVPTTKVVTPSDVDAAKTEATPTGEQPAATPLAEELSRKPDEPGADRRELDRVSRYNFDELGRILTDRISGNQQALQAPAAPGPAASAGARQGDGTLINLAGETFILNRLPLGILVFRDQQVLFANRALTELTGHDSIDSLRTAGLTSIFPAEDAATSGPVTHLVRRDGLLLPVNARLQSISWHGQPALMLSASLAEQRPVHEVAVKAFAELAAGLQEEGFIAADRGGVIIQVSLHGRIVLGRDEDDLVGQPLSALIDSGRQGELRAFLERPARFAETARPGSMFAGAQPGIEITLFAEGQAGVVSGYFGFVRRREQSTPAPVGQEDVIDAEVLGRVSRGIRRPLNTIIGFADLIRSAAFGPIDIPRYVEYAADIQEAGQEIAGLIDEIDDLTQLSAGSYVLQSDALDLVALLDTCVMRVRPQAAARRVLVRSAVSERLPRVKADRASLTQAILNLLASAVDQSPASGTVILSAQPDDAGGITVNVRDSAAMHGDIDERFVVFRDDEPNGGATLAPVRSSVGLALTRSLLAVNALKLTVDPVVGVGTLFSLSIPAELTVAE